MRSVLRLPGVLSAFVFSGVALLPMGALGLLVILHVRDVTGSYAQAGIVAASGAISQGLSNPLLARAADRRGQLPVLRLGAPVAAAAIFTQAFLPDGAPVGLRVAAAILAGAAQPPVGAFRRRLWNELIPEGDMRHRTFAVEGALMEVVYIMGPVVIVGGLGSISTRLGLCFCGAAVLVGNLAFSRHPAVRALVAVPSGERDLAGALRAPAVVVTLATFVTLGVAVGAAEVGVPATLQAMDHRSLTGLCLGLWGLGSLLAGVAMARTRPPQRPERTLGWLVAAWGAFHALVALAGTPALVALTLLLAGATIAPTFTVLNGLLDKVALPGTLTEAFTWTSTGMACGVALGGAAAGALADAVSPAAALALGGVGLVGALIVAASQPQLGRRPVAVAA